MEIRELRIDYGKTSPCSVFIIRNAAPVFSWAIATQSKLEQQSYKVLVTCIGEVYWDTGWISSASQEVTYDGRQLVPGLVYCLSILLQGGNGYESTPAEQKFCYGSLAQWDAPWIYLPEKQNDEVSTFFCDFHVREKAVSACLFLCGLGYHKVHLNGKGILTNPMSPSYSEYEKRTYYSVVPCLEECLDEGMNRIGIDVAPGWRTPLNAFYKLTKWVPAYTGNIQLSAALRIQYENEEIEWLYTDETWNGFSGPITYSNIFIGEHFEAGRIILGWSLPRTRIVRTEAAALCDAPGGIMEPDTIEPVTVHEVYPATAILQVAEGRYIIDFGQNIAGVCRIRIPQGIKKGTSIEISHAEILDEDGSLFTAPLRGADSIDRYLAAGDGRDLEYWQPEFTYHGFRYAQVTGYPEPLGKDDITAVSLYSDVNHHGSFKCGNSLVNAIHRNVIQTEKSNIHSILTDCPQRDERVGWLNDATVRFEETPYNFDIGRIFPKVVRDSMDVQDEQGAITCTAPFAGGARPADPVCSSYLMAGWQAYMHTGNIGILREGYPGFRRWNEFLESKSENWIVQYSYYGDWAGPAYACQSEEYAVSAVTPGILMSTGYFFFNESLLAKIAEIIGREEDALFHRTRVDMIRQAFLKKWWDPETGIVATGSQGCQSFALWLDILPPEGRQKAADRLHEDLEEKQYQFTTGNLCTKYMLDVLSRFGYVEDAWKLITREDYPSWGYMIQQEATTVWERFELKKNPIMNSHNHPMYGAVGYWFYAYLAGITPLEPGWKLFQVSPSVPNSLQSASATVWTPYGDIYVRWVKRYGEFHLHLDVPCGVRAKVRLPGGENATVGTGFHHFHEKQ